MTHYTGATGASKVQPGVTTKFLPCGAMEIQSVFKLTAALATNDIIDFLPLPAGFNVSDMILSSDTALDTNATSTLSYDIGDSNAAQRYVAAKAQSNNAALAPYHMDQSGGSQYQIGTNTGDNMVQAKIHAGAATGATSGNLRLTVKGSMDP